MYDYISGKLVELTPTHLVIDNKGIGYFIQISVSSYTKFQQIQNNTAIVYIESVIREDSHVLFGFFDKEERRMFQLLVSVSGVGGNTANMMLSSLEYPDLQKSILSGDVTTLTNVKGIGAKTAQRIIIDLKDKIGDGTKTDEALSFYGDTKIKNEAMSALVMLGFPKNHSEKVIHKILREEKDLNVETLIKKALKQI